MAPAMSAGRRPRHRTVLEKGRNSHEMPVRPPASLRTAVNSCRAGLLGGDQCTDTSVFGTHLLGVADCDGALLAVADR
jgi:hypothetical protein